MEVLAIIPARGGSKGIPLKNIVPLAGRPLIDYSVDAAIRSEHVTRTIVSSENKKILEHCTNLGIEVRVRPADLAQDNSPSEPVILDVIQHLSKQGYFPDWIVFLQPTSPFRTAIHIDEAFMQIAEKGAKGAISVIEVDASTYKVFVTNKNGWLHGMVNDRAPFMRRQDCPKVFKANGAMYIMKSSEFLSDEKIPMERMLPYVMKPEESIDIDDPMDLQRAKQVLENING